MTDEKTNETQRGLWFYIKKLLLCLFVIGSIWYVIIAYRAMVGMGYEARYVATDTNLQTMRAAIAMYKAETGAYPSNNLKELYAVPLKIYGKMRTVLKCLPPELISKDNYSPAEKDPSNRRVYNKLGTEGGWFYNPKTHEVFVNYNKPLEQEWWKYAGQNPSQW